MIVSDSTAIIHLSRIGKLDILKEIFKEVLISETVYEETIIKGREKSIADSENISSKNWIIKEILTENQKTESNNLSIHSNLGKSESEAIILAKTKKLDLIIDDLVGVKIAQTFNIDTYWTTSVIIKGVSEKILKKTESKDIIEKLVQSGYRLKPEALILILNKLV